MINIAENSLKRYLADIANIPVLSIAEEIKLGEALPADWAREKLIYHNLKFVISTAKKFQNTGLPLPDLISEGNIGLCKAAEKFDVTRGFKFISYAVWWIRQAIMQALDQKARVVRLPQNKIQLINQIKALDEAAARKLEKLGIFDYSRELGLSVEHIKDALTADKHLIYFDDVYDDDGVPIENPLSKSIVDCESFPHLQWELISREQKELWDSVLHIALQNPHNPLHGPRAVEIVKAYFGFESGESQSLEMIGKKHNITRERCRQIKDGALRQLRHYIRRNPGALEGLTSS